MRLAEIASFFTLGDQKIRREEGAENSLVDGALKKIRTKFFCFEI